MPVPPEAIGPATLAISSGISLFQGLLPPLTEIRKKDPGNDPEFAADVRMGEFGAVAILLGIGAITSTMVGTPAPLSVSMVVAALLVALYEWTLRGRRFSAIGA
jgi:hypothetical protein